MGSIPILKSSEVAEIHRKLEFELVRQRGFLQQFRDARGRCTTVPFHKGRDLSPPLRRQIAKDIGMTLEDFIADRLTRLRGIAKHRLNELAGGRKPSDIPTFQWLNTAMENVKSSLSGTDHSFNVEKYGNRYPAEIAYRFHRRFNLKSLPQRLLNACISCRPFPEHQLRAAELHC